MFLNHFLHLVRGQKGFLFCLLIKLNTKLLFWSFKLSTFYYCFHQFILCLFFLSIFFFFSLSIFFFFSLSIFFFFSFLFHFLLHFLINIIFFPLKESWLIRRIMVAYFWFENWFYFYRSSKLILHLGTISFNNSSYKSVVFNFSILEVLIFLIIFCWIS